ncbi:MAG: twin-arginine translocase TatA/TatE family subunit [Propionibacteriaceae bacterium]|jgi:sec-independent protein translocase protein TatA|nr:twin-arginine translocase TatA/TatE family subunit [Propionibacteriaceae bacterium]
MFGTGWGEALIVLVVGLLVFGGTRVANLGKNAGKAIHDFKEEVTKKEPETVVGTPEVAAPPNTGSDIEAPIADSPNAAAPVVPIAEEAAPVSTQPTEQA